MKTLSHGIVSLSILLGVANARLFNDPSQVHGTHYDFIVVGAGTAGCVIANRLTETSAKVLLIEAGIENAGQDENIPFFGPNLAPDKGPWDWNYTIVPQEGLFDRTFAYPRGKMLGGSSSINYMLYNRASLDYFNAIASITGDKGWSWDSLVPYMNKAEHLTPPADNHNATGQFLPSAHGFEGPLLTSLGGSSYSLDALVMEALDQIPGYPFNEDMNSGNQLGVGWSFASIGGRIPQRYSSALGYLAPALNRTNLDVLIQSQVTKLVKTGVKGTTPSFTGVEVSTGPNAKLYNFNATKEVILSAGSIGTPQILMLSGIGNATELGQVGISPIVNSPEVGRNLQDHPLLPNQYYVNSTDTWETSIRNATLSAENLKLYQTQGKGPLVNTLCNQIGWLRIPDNSSIWENYTDPSTGPTSAHYEIIFNPGFVAEVQSLPSTGNFMTLTTNLVTVTSRGSVTLTSNSAWDYPLIDPAFLKDELDYLMMREAFLSHQTFIKAPAFDGFVLEPFGSSGASTDEEIEAHIRNFTTTVWHPTSSAAMGNGTSGVVGPNLLVNGASGLRIIDASVLPMVPPAHPEAPLYAMAERAADLIKGSWGLRH